MDLRRSAGSDSPVNERRLCLFDARSLGRLGLGSLLAVCFACTPTIDPASLSSSIKTKFEGQGVTVNSITCPSDRPMKKDETFQCQGVSGKGDAFTVKVTQTDDQGNFNAELEGKVFDPAAFADEALRHFTNNRKVDCGKERFIAVNGTEMACAVEGGKSATLKFGPDGKLDDAEIRQIIGAQ